MSLFASSPVGTPGGQRPYTLDDWHFNAEQLNVFGERMAASGICFGYHNHTREFVASDAKTPYTELVRLTDARKVNP